MTEEPNVNQPGRACSEEPVGRESNEEGADQREAPWNQLRNTFLVALIVQWNSKVYRMPVDWRAQGNLTNPGLGETA